ncbi:MAG: hypothetical protein AB1695_04275 [Stygiobacter sp.]|uniref:Uncharacterized protein n=1 Tax=Stygiobacter electus TaxID=3032292 RepID=A0AAE3NZP1_9BACT|nr:hypothetical protein [Stygiobacter electus]MDF1611697.1 hypothetical protein [Stygiobacter electus]
MSSFTCSHFDQKENCLLLKTKCVPGRKGCVLKGKVEFIISADQRLKNQKDYPFKEYRRKKK